MRYFLFKLLFKRQYEMLNTLAYHYNFMWQSNISPEQRAMYKGQRDIAVKVLRSLED